MDAPSCVSVINKARTYKVNIKLVTRIAAEICERLGVHHYEVCLQFVGPRSMRTLNKKFRDKDKSTDVLSFPQYTWKKALKVHTGKMSAARRKVMNPMPLGDIVISLDDAYLNSKESKHGLDQEVCFLVVHGMLHLVGHDHMKPGEKKLMFGEQKKLMKFFAPGSSNPALWTKCVVKTRTKKGR